VEVSAEPIWCEIRKVLFGLTKTKFPFNVRADKTLTVSHAPIITVTGKAFFDINHAPKDQSNRRTDLARVRCLGNSSSDESEDVKKSFLNRLRSAVRAKSSVRRSDFG
jgi:hypothetical protein